MDFFKKYTKYSWQMKRKIKATKQLNIVLDGINCLRGYT